MNNPSLFNSTACSAGEAAGHVAAACVSARSESAGASVCDARDAISSSHQPHVVQPHVAQQAQNFGAGAEVNELPSTIKNAGSYTSADSTIKVSGSNAPELPSTIENAGSYTSADSTIKVSGSNAPDLPSTIKNAGSYTSADSTIKVSGANAPGLPSTIENAGSYTSANSTIKVSGSNAPNLPSTIKNAGSYTSADSTIKVSGSNAPNLPSTIENAGSYTSADSTTKVLGSNAPDPPSTIEDTGVDQLTSSSKGSSMAEINAFFFKSVSRGRARRPAARDSSVSPSIRRDPLPDVFSTTEDPSTNLLVSSPDPIRPSAGVAPIDAVAPSVAPSVALPSVPSAALPLPPWGDYGYNRGTLYLRLAPAVPSVSPPTPRRRAAASTNDSPISQPTGAAAASTNDSPISQPTGAAAASMNESTSKAWLHVDRPVKPGIKLIAAAGTKALPVQIPDSPVSTHNTSPNLGRSEEKPKESKAKMRENEKSEAPQVIIEESVKETPKGTKKSKARMRENKKLKTPSSEAKPNNTSPTPPTTADGIKAPPMLAPIIYPIYSTPDIFTAKEDRAYQDATALKETEYFYEPYQYTEVTSTQVVSEPPKPLARSYRCPPPQTSRMSHLEKEAVKNARNTPKAVSNPPVPFSSPTAIESEQTPTAGIPSVRALSTPTASFSIPIAVEAEQAPTTGMPPVPVPLDPAILPQDIETAGFTTAESIPSPPQAVAPVQVPLIGAQTTAANTARNQLRTAALLLRHRQGLINSERVVSETKNNAARTAILTQTTSSRHVRLRKRNLTALTIANKALSPLHTILEEARILVARESEVQEQPCPTPNKPIWKHKPSTNPLHLYKAATRRLNAATLNWDYLLKEQERLTATQGGPFLDPGSRPTVLALPFVPPSWAVVTTGGYRHHRMRRHLHAKHPPSRKETLRANLGFRRSNHRKTPRSCSGSPHGPNRPLSGSLHFGFHSVLRYVPLPLSRKETRSANHCIGRLLKRNQKIKKILRSSPLPVDGNPARGSLSRSQVLKFLTGSKVITKNEKKKKKRRGPAGR